MSGFPSSSGLPSPSGSPSVNQVPQVSGTSPLALHWATVGGNPTVGVSTPTTGVATASTTFVMLGAAGSFTPASTGNVWVLMTGYGANGTATDGFAIQIARGTGTAPINGAAATGTVSGQAIFGTSSIAGANVPFTIQAKITGLTVSTAYWLDLQYRAVGAGSFSVTNLTIITMETA